MMFNIVCFLCSLAIINGCTNIIVNSEASTDGSAFVSYNNDGGLYGALKNFAAADHSDESFRTVFEKETGKKLGEIKEPSHTFNVIGNIYNQGFMNEYGLVFSETTFGGIDSLQYQPNAIMNYQTLFLLALQTSTNARDAIKKLDKYMQLYGYASEGESFYIADQKETW
jgi:dipeptidase